MGGDVLQGFPGLGERPFENDVMLVKPSRNRELIGTRVDSGVTGMTKGHYQRLQDGPSHLLRPPGHLQ